MPWRCSRGTGGGFGLFEDATQHDQQMDATAVGVAGHDGFGRSEGRTSLREFFEVDSRFITLATLHELLADGKIERSVVDKAIKDLGINADKRIR